MITMVNILLVSRDDVNLLSVSECCSSSIERLIRPVDFLSRERAQWREGCRREWAIGGDLIEEAGDVVGRASRRRGRPVVRRVRRE